MKYDRLGPAEKTVEELLGHLVSSLPIGTCRTPIELPAAGSIAVSDK